MLFDQPVLKGAEGVVAKKDWRGEYDWQISGPESDLKVFLDE